MARLKMKQLEDTLVLTIEVPDFYADDVLRPVSESVREDGGDEIALSEAIDEELESLMQCGDEVVVVFRHEDEVDGETLKHLTARIVNRNVRAGR